MAFIRSKRAIIESEFDRNTVFFFFYFSRKESFCIEARIAGGGEVETGSGEAKPQDTGCVVDEGGEEWWLTREFKTSGIRWWCVTRDSHMRGACDVYGLLRGGRCRVSARAPNTAWKPFTTVLSPPYPLPVPLLEHRKIIIASRR